MTIAACIIILIWSSLISGCIGYLIVENRSHKINIEELYELTSNNYDLSQKNFDRIYLLEKKGEVHGSTSEQKKTSDS